MPTEQEFIKKRQWFENRGHKPEDTIGDQEDSVSGKGKTQKRKKKPTPKNPPKNIFPQKSPKISGERT